MSESENDAFKRLERIKDLPTLPLVIDRLSKAVRDPNSDARRIAGIINDDPVIMARVLRVANSAFYGTTEPITSLQLAVSRMGMRALSNIALSTAVISSMGKQTEGAFDWNAFWRHSICCGLAAAVINERAAKPMGRRYGKDVLHLAGLLHDVGKLVMARYFHAEFERAMARAARDRIPLWKAERDEMGADHAQIGAWLGVRWQLPEESLQVMRWHHQPSDADESARPLVFLVHAANYICNQQSLGVSGDMVPEFESGVWRAMGLGVGDIPEMQDKIVEAAKQSEVFLTLSR